MKILMALGNYPQLSETYVTSEIDFFVRSGLMVEIWSPSIVTPGIPEQVKTHRGPLHLAIQSFRPDLVHCHYVHFALGVDALLSGIKVPMTIRGHSFDFSVEGAERAAALGRVKKVYLFPHLAKLCKSPKMVPLPVAYNSQVYQESNGKDRKLVLRLAAAKADKGLGDFIEASKNCPDHTFVLGVADVADSPKFFDRLKKMNAEAGGRVELLQNVPWDKARELTRRAGIYLGTSDPHGHPFGMPISFAESLATGSFVLLRNDVPASMDYLGIAGAFYGSPQDAARIIRDTLGWDDEGWKEAQARAVARASLYSDRTVLPKIIEDWKRIVLG